MKYDHLWIKDAIGILEADQQRSADTHLIKLRIPALRGIDIYLKDESTHPTGSLKHRLARSLFLYGISNGWIGPETPVIEASSGSTAISEAYFAQLLGLPFYAVMPRSTAKKKIEQIEFFGGIPHFVDRSCEIYDASQQLAKQLNGHYMDQFTYAERATDWRGNSNIAESIFHQMRFEPHPEPDWIVMSAGTGGTSATIGRYVRYKGYATQLCVADCENSVFYDSYMTGNTTLTDTAGSRIEGIGRPRVEPSFMPGVIDNMKKIADVESIATIRWLESKLGKKVGASTGTNVYASLLIAQEMQRQHQTGSIVTLLCDSGERYLDTYYNDDWVNTTIGDISSTLDRLMTFDATGSGLE
ncbi:PLP-dependent cysteine synthase family protein [Vibrio sp.]|nr:PLP-dependent cysteine synthase family protein [Vibrio sp.]